MHVLRFNYSKDPADMRAAESELAESLKAYERLASLTEKTYRFANSMQTSQRKIPVPGGSNGVGTNYHWMQLVGLYRRELDDFHAKVAQLKTGSPAAPAETNVKPWPAASFKLIGTNGEAYAVKPGAKVWTDRGYTIAELALELNGLTGIRFSHDAAKSGRYEPVEFEVSEPVEVLIGYFQNPSSIWLHVPDLETAAHADERGGIEPVLLNAAVVEGSPGLNVHAFRYEAGRHKLELIGKGSFVVLGVVPQSVELKRRDVELGKRP
jgi:hypothetical protein